MNTHTGKYRVRKGWFGKSILQELKSYPSFIGGKVDSSVRELIWEDVSYKHAPARLLSEGSLKSVKEVSSDD